MIQTWRGDLINLLFRLSRGLLRRAHQALFIQKNAIVLPGTEEIGYVVILPTIYGARWYCESRMDFQLREHH
jgi:hypothetical protein